MIFSTSKTAREANMYDCNTKVHKGAQSANTQDSNMSIILTSKWTKTFLLLKEINAKHAYDIPKELKRSKDNDLESICDCLAQNRTL